MKCLRFDPVGGRIMYNHGVEILYSNPQSAILNSEFKSAIQNPQSKIVYFTLSTNQPPLAIISTLNCIPVFLESLVTICAGPSFAFQSFFSINKISPGIIPSNAVLTGDELPFLIVNCLASSLVIFLILMIFAR